MRRDYVNVDSTPQPELHLTTALRPSYLPDEVLLFVQDNVGLYEGKFKLPNQQDGQVYLTSHRICYVDKEAPRKHSVALDLKAIERYEFYAGFLKSSAKITLVPKPPKRANAAPARAASPRVRQPQLPTVAAATWVCVICSFSNPVPSNFDPGTATAHTPLPSCLACGIKPTLTHVLKAAITSANNRPAAASPTAESSRTNLPLRTISSSSRTSEVSSQQASPGVTPSSPSTSFQCPRCTFSNHPSLLSCEMCGASLIIRDDPAPIAKAPVARTESPGPVGTGGPSKADGVESVKLSFRGGGEKIFYERLKGAMTQRKWLLQGAPPIPTTNRARDESPGTPGSDGGNMGQGKAAGIAALEKRGLDMRKNNELMIGDAFEDLESLMASAKEIVALAEQFARQGSGLGGNAALEANALANQLGLVTTKDIVGGGSSETLYLSELARNLAEFITDDARGVLKSAGGVISLVDLWATFNRARGGVELVSPRDFEKAAMMWEKLKLPVRLRKFKSGVMVVQSHDRTDETTIAALLGWLNDLHEFPPEKEVPWDWHQFGLGITAQDAAQRFGWSIGVAEEELEMAEERGVVCREEGIEGLKFWKNHIDTGDIKLPDPVEEDHKRITRALRENGLI